jgi:hypothetical protein
VEPPSALDAAELFNTGINFMREHVKPSVQPHVPKMVEFQRNPGASKRLAMDRDLKKWRCRGNRTNRLM